MTNQRRVLNPEILQSLFVIAAGVALVTLNVLRIIRIPMTFDECGNFPFPGERYRDIILHFDGAANNHPLNTLMRKFFIETFGNTPFFVRVDSLLAQVIFLIASYLICRRIFKGALWQIAVFLLLNLQPFMFEFWGLSRGYGLAVAFMTAAIYFLLQYLQVKKTGHLALALFSAILSVYSNFALLNFYCGITAVVFLIPLLPLQKATLINFVKKEFPVWLAATAILYFLVAEPIRILRATDQLYYGGERDLIHDTTMSLVRENLYIGQNRFVSVLSYGIVLAGIAAGIYWIVRMVKHKNYNASLTGLGLWLLLAVPAASLFFQHLLLHVKYLIDRTALFFIVLFLLQFAYWIYDLKFRIVKNGVLILITIFACVNFLRNANVTQTRVWWFDANNVTVINRIMKETREKPQKIKLAVSWIFYPSMWYYTFSQKNDRFDNVGSISAPLTANDTTCDYYYIFSDQVPNMNKRYVVDTSFAGGAFMLMRKQ